MRHDFRHNVPSSLHCEFGSTMRSALPGMMAERSAGVIAVLGART